MPDTPPQGTVLAFDFGTKRIGVALGETTLLQAHPLTTIHSEINAERFAAIAALIKEWSPVLLVVGLPVSVDGQAHEMTARATRFANQLQGRFALKVAFADERFSSCDAEEKLKGMPRKAKTAKNHVDALAAQTILQSYFDGVNHPFSEERHETILHRP